MGKIIDMWVLDGHQEADKQPLDLGAAFSFLTLAAEESCATVYGFGGATVDGLACHRLPTATIQAPQLLLSLQCRKTHGSI